MWDRAWECRIRFRFQGMIPQVSRSLELEGFRIQRLGFGLSVSVVDLVGMQIRSCGASKVQRLVGLPV